MIFLTPYILETPQHASGITTQIINEGQSLSEAEGAVLKRNHEDYNKSVNQQNITKEVLDPTAGTKDKKDDAPKGAEIK